MHVADPAAILGRISRASAEDLDDLLSRYDDGQGGGRSGPAGRDLFPALEAVLMPEVRFRRPDAICVGFTVPAELPNTADRAMRLAAMALERDVTVIVLAGSDLSGFERFGFRTERIAGETPAALAACEDQVRRFWNLDLVL